MRRLPILGGVALALLTATSAFAVTPPTSAPSTTNQVPSAVVVHPAHRWTTSFADGSVKVRAILRASAPYAGGSLTVRVAGVKRGQKLTFVLAKVVDATTTPLLTRTVTIRTRVGHVSVTRYLARTALRALKTLPAGATLTLTVTTNGTTAMGTFSGK